MKQTKAYIILSSVAFVPIFLVLVGYIATTRASSNEIFTETKSSNTIYTKRNVGRSKEIIARSAPLNPEGTALADIKPIELNGVRYEELWYPAGTLRATDMVTREVIWQKQIYKSKTEISATNTIPLLFSELVVEDLGTKGTYLKIINENGEVFLVHPKTAEIEILTMSHYAQKY